MIYIKVPVNEPEHLSRKDELDQVLEKHEEELKGKLVEFITHAYFNAMMEIDRRRLPQRLNKERPRIDYYLRSMLFYMFSKLHKGDKIIAMEIIEELRNSVLSLK